MKNILRQIFVIAISTILCLSLATICKGIEYKYIEILPLRWAQATATDINNNGDVVGWGIDDSGVTRSFIYSNGIYTYLPLDAERAFGINDSGVVVGDAKGTGLPEKFFVYSDGILTTLVPEGWLAAAASCINNKGDVAGYGVPTISGNFKGFIYSNGAYSFVPPPAWAQVTSAGSFVYDINNNGVAVGYGGDTFFKKGFIYSNEQYEDLQPQGWWSDARAYGINDNGVIVGSSDADVNDPYFKGFIYNNGEYTFLVPQDWNLASAFAINNNGEVVGNGGFNTNDKGFIYFNGEYTVLLPPGWQRASGDGINDNGVVIGNGKDGSGQVKGFIATPIATTPEEQIQTIIKFFDDNVASDNLNGVAKTEQAAEGKLKAFGNMLKEAQYLIENEYIEACEQLMSAYKKIDGQPQPPDFIEGSAAEELASKINALIQDLNCM